MKITNIYLISGITCMLGMCMFAYFNQWIIIRLPFTSSSDTYQYSSATNIKKKQITLFFWKHNRWQQESTEIVWHNEKNAQLYHLVTAWLSLLEDESLIQGEIFLQSVLISASSQEAYLSFDRDFLPQQDPLFNKWMLIESLLKTISYNGIGITHVRFLIQHTPYVDYHLDFSNAWPIGGFLSS